MSLPELTDGYLLGGRVRYAQPLNGYRTGIEPILLAASVPARVGERVLEAGCGAGAGLLCLAARVPGVMGVGVECDPQMAAIARHNAASNEFDQIVVHTADVMAWRDPVPFDHAFANPPWHREDSSASPLSARDQAKRARHGLLNDWIGRLLRAVKTGGSVGLILPANQFAQACAALETAGAAAIRLLPLWPRAGRQAKLVLILARKGRGGAAQVLPGLVLHEGDGYAAAARAILREGASL